MAAIDYIPPRALSGPNYFGRRGPFPYRLQTLLTLTGYGSVTLDGRPLALNQDFMSVPIRQSGRLRVSDLAAKIPSCTVPELRKLIHVAATKNFSIHENIAREVLHCIAHYRSGSYIASFLHLYRLIEHAALYLPLVSVVSKGVHNTTFLQYKEVISGGAKSDLSVLRNFSSTLLDQNLGRSVATYSFSGSANPAANVHLMSTLLRGKAAAVGADFVDLKYEDTDRLIVAFRNQFFHYLFHEENISLKDLSDPDGFLKVCMPRFISYFSFLFREFLIAEWELWA